MLVPVAQAAKSELLHASFDAAIDHPLLALRDEAEQADGVLKSTSLANWRRGGLEVGPISMPQAGAITIDYDFKPVRFTHQGQSFVS